ncbi:MAG: O-antigen ligase family protein [Fastidiosipila sp.]|nr:O-antigen ligase family protein [Fastidiosipila sp.]
MPKKLVYIIILAAMTGNPEASSLKIIIAGSIWNLSLFRFLLFLLFIFTLVNDYRTKKEIGLVKRKDARFSLLFMFIWLVYAVVSIFWVKDRVAWIAGVFFLTVGFVSAFLLTRYLKSSEDILETVHLTAIMLAFHNLMGWYEVFSGNYIFYSRLFPDRIAEYTTLRYPVSNFKNVNDFSTLLLLSIWISYICWKSAKNNLLRILSIALMLSSTVLLFQTGSRANIAGLFLSLMVFFIIKLIKKKQLYIIFIVGVSLLIVLILLTLLNPGYLSALLPHNADEISVSDQARLRLILNGLHFVVVTYGFGVGAGNIAYWLANEAKYETFLTLLHNWWLEILATYGIVIFLLYIIFYLRLFISMVRKYKAAKDRQDSAISIAFASFIGGFLIAAISSSTHMTNEWLWVLWGLLIAYQGVTLESGSTTVTMEENRLERQI